MRARQLLRLSRGRTRFVLARDRVALFADRPDGPPRLVVVLVVGRR